MTNNTAVAASPRLNQLADTIGMDITKEPKSKKPKAILP
jgi:hypothetical protein